MDDLIKFTQEEHEVLMKKYGLNREAITYPMMLKLMEEVGELSEAVLHSHSLQRKEKLSLDSKVGEELADVIITTMIIGANLGLDIHAELKNKQKKILERQKDQSKSST